MYVQGEHIQYSPATDQSHLEENIHTYTHTHTHTYTHTHTHDRQTTLGLNPGSRAQLESARSLNQKETV